MNSETPMEVRLDKWLWASRFFKTRSAAAQAVSGGKVHLNGGRVKPARAVRVGDVLTIQREQQRLEVVVRAVSDRRGPAKVAQTLYEETEESRAARELQRQEKSLLASGQPGPFRRPGKRDRRLIRSFIRKDD